MDGAIPPSVDKGPFRMRLDVRPLSTGDTWVAGYVDGHQVASYKVDHDLAGWVSLFVDGEAEYVFSDLVLERTREAHGMVKAPVVPWAPGTVIGAF